MVPPISKFSYYTIPRGICAKNIMAVKAGSYYFQHLLNKLNAEKSNLYYFQSAIIATSTASDT